MKNNHSRAFHSQNAITMVMNSVRHLNKLKTVRQKTAHLIHLKQFNGIKFVESVLSIPELINAEELKRVTAQQQVSIIDLGPASIATVQDHPAYLANPKAPRRF